MIGRLLAKLAVDLLTFDKGDTSLWQRVGGRIYEAERPQSADLPCILVRTSTSDREDNFDRTVGASTFLSSDIDGQITVIVEAPLMDQETQSGMDAAALVGELGERVRDLLHGITVEQGTMMVTYIERQHELPSVSDESVTGEMVFAALGSVCKEITA